MIKEPNVTPYVRFEHCNEFGDVVKFESYINGVTLEDMFEVYKRFLLSCGWMVNGDIIEWTQEEFDRKMEDEEE